MAFISYSVVPVGNLAKNRKERQLMRSQMEIKHGTKGICRGCGAHLFTFSRTVYWGTPLSPAIFVDDKGQSPWRYGERCICRDCSEEFFNSGVFTCYLEEKKDE